MSENVQIFLFEDDGRIPNNPHLPLLIYTAALSETKDLTAACKKLFARNGWGGIWVDGVYNYHHYHSTAHEVLGVVGGSASIQFGGGKGQIIEVKARDVVVIPAGVGHYRKKASADFSIVGAYPAGQDCDLCTGEPSERPRVLENIQLVPLPTTDPVYGANDPLLGEWYIER